MSVRCRLRRSVVAGAVLLPLCLLAAAGCETVSEVPMLCRALGPQTQYLRSVDNPEVVNENDMLSFELNARPVTGIPAPEGAKLVSYDISLPLPPEVAFVVNARVEGGNMLGRALIEDRRIFIRFARGSAASVADVQLPKVLLAVVPKQGIAPTDMRWKAPDRIDVLVEWSGLLGADTCTPVDPAFEINTTHIQQWTPDTFPPGSYPGSLPPGSTPGTVPPRTLPVPAPTVAPTTVTTIHGH
jgi:hypothetical protein